MSGPCCELFRVILPKGSECFIVNEPINKHGTIMDEDNCFTEN